MYSSFAKFAVALVAVSSIGGCAYPTTTVSSGSERPTVVFVNAPAGASLYVDGMHVGTATEFDGISKALTVEPGRHHIRIVLDGVVHFERYILASSGERVRVEVGQ